MKNQILSFLAFIIFSATLSASNNPIKGVLLIDSKAVEVSIDDNSEASVFTSALFNESNEKLEFTTTDVVSFIQIFNSEGRLEFQLPINSKDISIGKSLFGEGPYKLGFILEGRDEIQFTEVRFN
jgi:hypothetical protein